MLCNNTAFDNLKSSDFAEDDQAFVNTILNGNFAINTDIIQSLRKILEKTTLASVSVSLVPSFYDATRIPPFL
jgi:hypothetical protein